MILQFQEQDSGISKKLHYNINEEDVELITRFRPTTTNVSDRLAWMHSKTGDYTVRSGYHVQHTHLNSRVRNMNQIQTLSAVEAKLYQAIWKMNIPPKLKNFWWRVSPNSLSVAETLRRRGCNTGKDCQLCGENEESLNHMRFQCSISKEIWELTQILLYSGDSILSDSLL